MWRWRGSLSVLLRVEESRKVVTCVEGWKVEGKRNASSCQRACPCFMWSMV